MTTAAGLPLPQLTCGRFAYSLPDDAGFQGSAPSCDGELTLHTDESLFESCGTRLAFTERTGGFSQGSFASLNMMTGLGDDDRLVEHNRQALQVALGCFPTQCIVPNQVHGTHVVEATSAIDADVAQAQQAAGEGCDAVVVGCSNLAALLCFADCLPLILVAPQGGFAVVHCGWRGAVAGLASKALGRLCAQSRCDASQVNAYIGPHICTECFEVGEEVARQFEEAFGSGVVARCYGDKPHVDLSAAVRTDLEASGVDALRIADAGLCSSCNTERFFSYRAEGGKTGRHGAFCVRTSDMVSCPC